MVYHGYQDVGVAVSTPKGLVVPVLRNAENMGLADVENTIRDFGMRAKDGKLGIEEMTGVDLFEPYRGKTNTRKETIQLIASSGFEYPNCFATALLINTLFKRVEGRNILEL